MTVTVEDEKLKQAINAKLVQLRMSKGNAIDAEQWGVVFRTAMKIQVLEEVLDKAKA
ncbi:hypothetical protein [Streptomyces sp. NPDC057363]|uniref:hypothetical protein n=1 Tax=Streptomyces sp. NPDC057363 TaxID=3346107 RepID=UPI003642F81B